MFYSQYMFFSNVMAEVGTSFNTQLTYITFFFIITGSPVINVVLIGFLG